MPSSHTCINPACPNRGIITIDANILFFLVEGTITYVQNQHPSLSTNARRLPRILEELDNYLGIIKGCCGLDRDLHISSQVFHEEVLEVDPEEMELIELSKYTRAECGQILRVLRNHFPQPHVVRDSEIQELRNLFPNPDICPDERDASLMVAACQLAANGEQIVVLTNDPDFIGPIKRIMHREAVVLGGETFPTNKIIYRDYSSFLLRLHDGCTLCTARYSPLADAYHAALVTRLPKLDKQEVINRDSDRLRELFRINSASIDIKASSH